MQLKDKKIVVVGLARSGEGAANLLAELGASVTVTDMKAEDELADTISRLSPSVKLALRGHPDDIFKSADMIVVSPGVPLDIKPLASARERGVKIIGELELAYQIIQNLELRTENSELKTKKSDLNSQFSIPSSQFPVLAVTGSNGKSTTTTLLDLMMRKGGFKTLLGGNIGNALTEEILKEVKSEKLKVKSEDKNTEDKSDLSPFTFHLSQDFVVAEVSSFQLEAIDKFRPHIASILNITPDHLDRYHSMSEYSDAKAKIFLNQQDNDFLVLNADDIETIKLRSEKLELRTGKSELRSIKPKIIYFSRKKEVEGVYLKNGVIYCNFPHFSVPTSQFPLISVDEVKIKGVHNLENAMAASAMALLANCPIEAVIDSLREFKGLEHRLELVRELDGVRYFNDSKGTNVGAVIKSIESFQEPLILIAGGRDKAGEFSALRDLVKERVKTLVLIGEAAGKIRDALGDLSDTIMATDMEEAVKISHDIARKGSVVLLSPACASFDMFRDFEDRGRQFKQKVMELKKQYA